MRPNKTLVSIIIALSAIFCWIPNQTATSQTDEMYHPVQLSLGTVTSASWQPHGETIAIGGSQGIRLYTSKFQFIKQLTSETTELVVWNPTGTKLASLSHDKLTLWDIDSGNAEFVSRGVSCPVTFSPDGNYLALGADNGEIRVVNVVDGSFVTLYEGQRVQPDEVDPEWTRPEVIMWNADGSEIISAGGKPKQLHAWDAQTGEFLTEIILPGYLHDLSCSAWIPQSPDRQKVFNINISDNVSASIWEIQSGSILASTEQTPPLAYFLKVTWNPDGTKLAALDLRAQTLTIWDAEDLSVLNTFALLPPSPDPTFASGGSELNASLDWSADGTKVLIGTIGGATIFDAQIGTQINRLQGYTGWANAIAWSPNGNYLATAQGSLDGYGDNSIRIWDTESSSSIATCLGHSGSVNDIAWSLDGSNLATVAGNGNSSDGTVRTWDFATCQELDGAWLGSLAADQVSWKPDGSELFATSTVVVIYTSNFSQLAEIGVYSSAAEWSPDGQKLAVGLVNTDNDKGLPNSGSLLIYETTNFSLLSTITGYSNPITQIEWSPDGSTIVTRGRSENFITITDLSSGNRITLTGHDAPVTAISWNATNNLLASAASDNTIRIWDMATGTEIAVFENQVGITDLAWSPDGTMLASCSETGDVIIWK